MLSLIVFLPLAAALALLALPRLGDTAARWAWVAVAAADLALVVAAWLRYDTPTAGRLAFEEQVEWIPGVNSSYHLGVDGLSLPLVAMTAVIFLACAIFALRETDRPRLQAALFLFLQSVSIGLFVAADLILFFVFFDLSIVGMYFVIAGWGHGNAARSAMKFFLYTFLGSLALLVGFIGLYIAADPHTFDMVELAEQTPFAGSSLAGGLVLIAASDTAYAYFAATREVWGPQETAVGWVLGFVAIGLGALSMPGADRGEADGDHLVPSRTSTWLPYATVAAATVLCAPALIDGMEPVFVGAAVAVFAVMVRQFLVIGENRRLLLEVADQARGERTAGPANGADPAAGPEPAANPDADDVPDAARLLGELRHAIDHGELTMFYQPKVDIRAGAIVGVEALIRWPHPRGGLLEPDRFLPLVRQHGLMRSMTTVVLELALDEAAEWYRRGVGVPVAVNVFAPAVSDPALPGQILGALQARGLSPQALTVEITEDLLLDDMDRTRSVLNTLRSNGIRVAIDDFGSGYSALWYLREFPVDEIKLDKEFVAPVLTQPTSAEIVRSVVNLAHALGITPVAEGVENAATAERLREFGCDVAQGYFYSRPLPAADTVALLSAHQRGRYVCDGTSRSEIELMQ